MCLRTGMERGLRGRWTDAAAGAHGTTAAPSPELGNWGPVNVGPSSEDHLEPSLQRNKIPWCFAITVASASPIVAHFLSTHLQFLGEAERNPHILQNGHQPASVSTAMRLLALAQ